MSPGPAQGGRLRARVPRTDEIGPPRPRLEPQTANLGNVRLSKCH